MADNGWNGNGFVEWIEGDTAFLSVVFSWKLQDAYQRAVWHKATGKDIVVGGPAIRVNPNSFNDLATVGISSDCLWRHNPQATFTSRGCVNKCAFCAVPIIEGDLVELDEWNPAPIVCDNNLLACSRKHFDAVIDRLKGVSGVDFNQGLDHRFLRKHHAERLTELDLFAVRLAWDRLDQERDIMSAIKLLLDAGLPKRKIRVYVLIGFDDTPDGALYRLEMVRGLGYTPNPMRYQPLDALQKDSYIAPGWTEFELYRMRRYFSQLRFFGGIPYDEFIP